MKIIKVPHPRVLIFHPDNANFQVLLADDDGTKTGVVTFDGTPEQQQDLAYEYAEFKKKQLKGKQE